MRYSEITDAGQPTGRAVMRRLMDRVMAAHRTRIWPEIDNPTTAGRAAMPHVIECSGLTVHDLGDAFAEEIWDRRLWCRENCEHEFTIEPIWHHARGRDTGRRFCFADQENAALFRLFWG